MDEPKADHGSPPGQNAAPPPSGRRFSEALRARAHPWLAAKHLEMLPKLPGWIVADDASVREEVAEWKGLTPAELWRLARHCSRDAVWAARVSGNPQRMLDQIDPLPETAVIALARLRQIAGWNSDGR